MGNREIIMIGNHKIKRPRICHDFKTTNFNSREFKWGYSMYYLHLTKTKFILFTYISVVHTFTNWQDDAIFKIGIFKKPKKRYL